MPAIIRTIDEWTALRSAMPAGTSLGFVPTMGALHEGHASLISHSLRENNQTAVSLFVNPTQFNNQSDFRQYPRTEATDIDMLRKLNVDYIFIPDYPSIYPDNFHYRVIEHNLSLLMEGTGRPGHFDGVLTVVMKLLNIIRPARSYFGEKDYQQYMLIKDMAKAFFMDVQVIPCATVRDKDGLALSSRNVLLSKPDRERAPLFAMKLKSGKPANQVKDELEQAGFTVDYITDYEGRRYGAVFLGGVRLIDNVELIHHH